jgi:hypothetical protein
LPRWSTERPENRRANGPHTALKNLHTGTRRGCGTITAPEVK